jgi:hypothetical protein
MPSRVDLAPGEHRAVLVVEEAASGVPSSERERVRSALRVAGKLAELTPSEKAIAAGSTATLEEISASLSRPGARPLSDIVLEMRGPKA